VSASSSIVLFDGVCNLCDSTVLFVIDRDPEGRFRFASLQSEVGARLLAEHDLPEDTLDTFVLIEDGRAFVRSTAALRVARRLPFPWWLLGAFLLVPAALRDPVYRWVARNRYRWFGTRESCRVPTPELRERFLEA